MYLHMTYFTAHCPEEERRQREQLEDRVHGLQEDKQLLEAQLEKLQEVLAQAPRVCVHRYLYIAIL